MDSDQCEHEVCDAKANVTFVTIAARKCDRIHRWCDIHASAEIPLYYKRTRHPQSHVLLRHDHDAVNFELECLAYYESTGECWMSLRDEAGLSRFPLQIGYVEFALLNHAVSPRQGARPLTHQTMNSIITRLNARLRHVLIHSLAEEEPVFYAHIALEMNHHLVLIDSRPTDAVALAIESDSPILVSNVVLEGIRQRTNLYPRGQ